jgi:nucleotide-binding universal stress UspA family protein
MKTVLLHVYGDEGQKARLDAAVALVRAFDGRLQCIQVKAMSSYVVAEPFGGAYMVGALYEALARQALEEKAKIDLELKDTGVPHEWIGFDGGVAQSIVNWSRLSDIIVLSKPDYRKHDGNHSIPIIADVAMSARSPVLAMPETFSGSFMPTGPAMIAWNGAPEGAHTLRAALPLLKIASAVTLISVGKDSDDFPVINAVNYLALHGVAATVREIPEGDAGVAEALMQAARAMSAAYIVMGAYGHSRFREAVLGGVTRAMLEHSNVPLLMAH